uniref:Uncharacterized protein n=1 Tax=Streptococcus suis TaxID=1307 RepID=A0A1X9I1K9_STRSU|nr:hypothetical protein [Streptococcus suis]
MLKNSNSAQYIYIKTKILPKIFWQDFWQETKSNYQFL